MHFGCVIPSVAEQLPLNTVDPHFALMDIKLWPLIVNLTVLSRPGQAADWKLLSMQAMCWCTEQ